MIVASEITDEGSAQVKGRVKAEALTKDEVPAKPSFQASAKMNMVHKKSELEKRGLQPALNNAALKNAVNVGKFADQN